MRSSERSISPGSRASQWLCAEASSTSDRRLAKAAVTEDPTVPLDVYVPLETLSVPFLCPPCSLN